MTLAVIDPAVKSAALSSFNFLSLMAKAPLTYHLPGLSGFDSLKSLGEKSVTGLVILGSYASPNEDLAWQRELEGYLEAWINADIPIFGICYGHQLLARMFGGEVDFCANGTVHSGFREVEVFKDERLGLIGTKRRLFASHREEVVRRPEAMELWAKGDVIAIEGLRHKMKPIWTLQTHPEANASFCQSRGVSGVEPSDLKHGCKVLKAFFQYCRVLNPEPSQVASKV